MHILEILLPKSVRDKDISSKHTQRIDALQKRMDKYVDKIGDAATSQKGREFLKAKLKDDYDELRSVIKDAIAEQVSEHIVKHGSGYRLLSHKGKNLGDFKSKAAAAKHEGEVEYFKHAKESIEEGEVVPFKKPAKPKAPIVGQIFSGSSYFMDKYAMKAFQKAGLTIVGIGGPSNDADHAEKDGMEYGHDEDIREYRVTGPQDKMQKVDAYLYRAAEMSGDEEGYGGSYPASDFNNISEEGEPVQKVETFEIVDSKTGKVVGKPYNSRSRARARVDRLDNEYGGYRFKVRKVGGPDLFEGTLNEAVHKLPLTNEDFELVRTLMSRPIPAVIAPIYIQEIIDDDEFNGMLNEFAEMEPGMDVRPHVVEWMRRVMPDQMYRFNDSAQTEKQKLGQDSVIHGYDPHMYHGSNDPITGDAYGRY